MDLASDLCPEGFLINMQITFISAFIHRLNTPIQTIAYSASIGNYLYWCLLYIYLNKASWSQHSKVSVTHITASFPELSIKLKTKEWYQNTVLWLEKWPNSYVQQFILPAFQPEPPSGPWQCEAEMLDESSMRSWCEAHWSVLGGVCGHQVELASGRGCGCGLGLMGRGEGVVGVDHSDKRWALCCCNSGCSLCTS